MSGNRITSVGGAALVVPAGATVIDGSGTFAIPGLWDMHAHVAMWGMEQTLMPLNIANGVTGLREMFGEVGYAKRVRADITSGKLVGPRFIFSGNIVDGFPPTRPGEVVVRNPDEGRRAVDSLADIGAEFVKVYSLLDSASFDAIAVRAKERKIPIAGHVPLSVTALHAARMGQRSMEHLEGVAAGCSREESSIVKGRVEWLRKRAADSAIAPTLLSEMRSAQTTMRRSFDQARCDALLRQLAALGVWQVPTMGVTHAMWSIGDPALVKSDRTRYLTAPVRQMWEMLSADTNFSRDTSGRVFNRDVERRIVTRMAALGVPVLAGTDAPNPFTYPAFGLHDELEMLVDAGFTPLQALRTATINPARYFSATDSLGSIAPGKLADLVLLSGNPLRDIHNTRRIHAVVANGKLYDRGALDAVLEDVAKRASAPSTPP
ncbi:MAG: amidohydrolase family protein, partial [Gemmatimonadaceae bacterium]